MRIERKFGNRLVLTLLSVAFVLSCKSTPEVKETETVSPGEGTIISTNIPVPGSGANSDSVSAGVLSLIEYCTPATLSQAASELLNGKSPSMLSGKKQAALALCGHLMSILFPLETWNYPIPVNPVIDPYLDSVASAKIGVYDYNSGNFDYLSLTLPSLVLLYSPRDAYFSDARESLEKALSINPEGLLAGYLLGVLEEVEGKKQQALSRFSEIYTRDKGFYPAGVRQAKLLIEMNRGSEAVDIATEIQSRFPKSRDLSSLCAKAYFSEGNWNEADKYISAILKEQPDNGEFLLMRVRVLIEQKDYIKANSLLDAYSKVDKQAKDYLLLRSRVQLEWNKNIAAASQTVSDAVELFPGDLDVMLAAARVCFQGNVLVNGMTGGEYINTILLQDPGNIEARIFQVSDAVEKRDWKTAVESANQVLATTMNTEILILLTRAYLGQGKSAEALKTISPLYSEDPQNTDILNLYLQSLIETGSYETASSIIQEQLSSASSAKKSVLYYNRSRLASNEEQQLSDLRSSLLSDPRNQEALISMYGYYYGKKEYKRASYYLKQAIAINPSDTYLLKLQTDLDNLTR